MELVLLVDAGLTTQQALAAATINPARANGRSTEQGTIERGKLADLLVLDADPLADIHNIARFTLSTKVEPRTTRRVRSTRTLIALRARKGRARHRDGAQRRTPASTVADAKENCVKTV
jgi:predicted amidohydrolase YtcJ